MCEEVCTHVYIYVVCMYVSADIYICMNVYSYVYMHAYIYA